MRPVDATGGNPLAGVAPVDPAGSAARAGDPRHEFLALLTRIAVGRTMAAEIVARHDDGSYSLRIADAAVRAELPRAATPGEILNLKLVAREPKPVFLLQEASDDTTLTPAGRLIGKILDALAASGGTAAVPGNGPLLPAASADSAKIAIALRVALAESGLFYESHLRQWVNGGRSMAELAREPQARFGDTEALMRGDKLPAALAIRPSAFPSTLPSSHTAFAIEIVHAWPASLANAAATMAGMAAAAGGSELSAMLPPGAAELVGLQLQTLEQQRARWSGELWPGQPFEWEVGENDENGKHARGGNDAPVQDWISTLKLSLPHLGNVQAELKLSGERLHIAVHAKESAAAETLRGNAGRLAAALDAAGLPQAAVEVRHE